MKKVIFQYFKLGFAEGVKRIFRHDLIWKRRELAFWKKDFVLPRYILSTVQEEVPLWFYQLAVKCTHD